MITLYYYPSNASMTPHMVLRDIGCPFELQLVDRNVGEHHTPAYKKLNPTGRIPTLVDGDLTLHETAAIVLHLVDKFPQSGLAPAFGTAERSTFYKWLVYLTNTVQANVIEWFYPERFTTDPAGTAAVRAASEARLAENLTMIDEALAGTGPYLLGGTFSAADYYLYMLVRWCRFQPKPARAYPNLLAHADRVLARPAAQAVIAEEKLTEVY